MRKLVLITAALGTVFAGATAALPASASAAPAKPAPSPATTGGIAWTPCPDQDPLLGDLLKGLECGTYEVPLDYAKPHGKKLRIALSRARHTAPDSQYQGIVLLNRGGPGGFGRDLPTRFARGTSGLPIATAAKYDWIGFDPRGVAGSDPQIACDPSYLYPGKARARYVPGDAAEERAWLTKARVYAADCGEKYGAALAQMTTKNVARDMDAIRATLGQRQTNYFGYSYGTYLGSVYASMFPNRVRRMVLDSVVRPSGVWYGDNLDQNVAFERRIETFFAWIAKWDSVYHLGTTRAAVERNYYKGLATIEKAPVDGKIGPAEYADIFLPSGYRNYTWIAHAQALSDYVVRGDPKGLRDNFAEPAWLDQNSYAIYLSVECRDAAWPRNWSRWHADASRQHRAGATFYAWANTWYNAPCESWPVRGDRPQRIGAGKDGPPILMIQPENDAATPAPGAYEVHKRFPTSRLVLEADGNNHGASISPNANPCLNGMVTSYFDDGTRPPSRPGEDARCAAMPEPDPTKTSAATAAQASDIAVAEPAPLP